MLFAFAIYWFFFKASPSTPKEPKQAAVVQKKHTEAFNSSIDMLVNSYLQIKDAFVEGDTARAKQMTGSFINNLGSLQLDELKSDGSMIFETAQGNLSDIQANAESLLRQPDITEMRRDFSTITELMYPFLKTVNYEGEKLYLQSCPMAFNDDETANWISNNEEIVNPYLGRNHPKYKAGMLHCGEIKDTIKAMN